MATLTVDLLTGKVYLFSGDFSGSGSTPTSGSTYPEVNLYSELPPPAGYSGQIYIVRSSSGSYVLNRKEAGLYFSTGVDWRRLGDIPSFFLSNNFSIVDSDDNSKGVNFQTSGITSGNFRTLTVQNSDGTIAYLSDLDSKVNVSAFSDYTGNTAPNIFVDWNYFSGYTATTLSLLNTKQDNLVEGDYISISGNVISVTGLTKNIGIQLIDGDGGQQVNNVEITPIIWTSEVFSGDSLNFTGGSPIYIEEGGNYNISYVLNLNNDTNSYKNIGTVIRKNGNVMITPMGSSSNNLNLKNDTSTNIMPEYMVNLSDGDYIELLAFRIGFSGEVYTKENSSWIRIIKL